MLRFIIKPACQIARDTGAIIAATALANASYLATSSVNKHFVSERDKFFKSSAEPAYKSREESKSREEHKSRDESKSNRP